MEANVKIEIEDMSLDLKLYDYTKHGDFKELYCEKTQRHFWIVGYMDDQCAQIFYMANKYSSRYNSNIQNIRFEVITKSCWVKNMGMFWDSRDSKPQTKSATAKSVDDVFQYIL